tara:strand:- start:1086 stop:1457 length:372 start_codon:yes stop_codon:yes gene_type:complete
MYSLNQLREFKKALNSESLPYEEETDQGKKIIIYITKKDNKEYLIKFKFMECLNSNYGHSYYLETIRNHQKNCGLCLNGDTYNYESLDYEKMNCVKAYIEGFLTFINRKNNISSPYKLYKKNQ